MTTKKTKDGTLSSTMKDDASNPGVEIEKPAPQTREIGGREGPDPTRFGDWEKNGRCIDF